MCKNFIFCTLRLGNVKKNHIEIEQCEKKITFNSSENKFEIIKTKGNRNRKAKKLKFFACGSRKITKTIVFLHLWYKKLRPKGGEIFETKFLHITF